MANEVIIWLNDKNRNYQAGVKLYNKYKIHNKHDNFFGSVTNPPANSMQFKLLHNELLKINRKLLQKPQNVKPEVKPIAVQSIKIEKQVGKTKSIKTKKTSEPKRPRIIDNPLVNVKELPEELQRKYFENKELTLKMNGLHTYLQTLDKDPENDPKRKGISIQLAELDDKRAANWKEIDTWWKANKENNDPGESKPLLEKHKRINNLKNYINRTKKQIGKNPQREKELTEKINEWQKELNELTGE